MKTYDQSIIECPKFSFETISDTLKFFLERPKKTREIERNLLAKRFLSNIFYSPESIKIRFISSPSGGDLPAVDIHRKTYGTY